jgi:DNA gyrase subunit A
LAKNDEIVALESLPKDGKTTILTTTIKGYGKRTELEEYRKTSRGAKGVITLDTTDKTGDVLTALSVNGKDSIIATTSKGAVIRVNMRDIRVMGRATQGVRIVNLKEGDKLADVVKVPVADDLPIVESDGQKKLDA